MSNLELGSHYTDPLIHLRSSLFKKLDRDPRG